MHSTFTYCLGFCLVLTCVSSIDATLTHYNIAPVMKEVNCWWKIGIADPFKGRIMQSHSTETEQSCKAGKYWIDTCPFASWESLALKLYYSREDSALEKVAQYLPRGTYIDGYCYCTHLSCLIIFFSLKATQSSSPILQPSFLTKLGHNHTHF